jgi:hypothetical protein
MVALGPNDSVLDLQPYFDAANQTVTVALKVPGEHIFNVANGTNHVRGSPFAVLVRLVEDETVDLALNRYDYNYYTIFYHLLVFFFLYFCLSLFLVRKWIFLYLNSPVGGSLLISRALISST